MSRSLAEWLDWQSSLNLREIDLGLDRLRRVWDRLGAPRVAPVVVSVAGTNGKGSTVALLEAIYAEAGYRVAAYTSPHLERYNERIRVDRREVGDADICAAFARIEAARGDEALTYFEFGTLAALLIFADAGLDIAVLEVGLGGRLDAVNLVDAQLAVITGIALDHQDWLGDNLEDIGFEKAGIMRAGCPAVYGGRDMPASIGARARELGVTLYRPDESYTWQPAGGGWTWRGTHNTRPSLPMPAMRGPHQLRNAAAVIQVIELLSADLPVDQAAVRSGLLSARLAGRFEVYPGDVTWIYDVAHNPEAAGVLSGMLGEQFVSGRTHAVFGMLADKDVEGVVSALLPRVDRWYLLSLDEVPRGLNADALAQRIRGLDADAGITQGDDLGKLLTAVEDALEPGDRVLVTGSFMVVGPALQHRQRRSSSDNETR